MSGAAGSQLSPELAESVARARWYHSIRLPDGSVTPGEYDLIDALERVPLPASFDGQRCLDVGTRDGFWAFEMERRGAREVVGIDIDDWRRLDWPQPLPQLGETLEADLQARLSTFGVASRALSSEVRRLDLSVYDLDEEAVGTFDFAFMGTLQLHLRDPAGALIAIRRVLRGRLLLNEPISVPLSLAMPHSAACQILRQDGPFWTLPNVAGLLRRVESAGYRVLDRGRPYFLRYGPSAPRTPVLRRGRPVRGIVDRLVRKPGVAHVWVLAEPVHQR